jgi:transcriptional regulator with PAS, ATPase and Fis domain
MVGRSPLMLDVFARIRRAAPHFRTALITGATGTGKELVARAMHRLGPVAANRMAVLNCSAIVETLFESELFGYVKGAFTGAAQDKVGLFEYANGGTVFLDEIGDMPLSTQSKLLRVLEYREFQRVGSPVTRKTDVRVVAATNRDLHKMVEEGKFREDLWFRLNVVRIVIPPLRERRGDVPLLARFFLNKYNALYNVDVKLTESGIKAMQEYTWPGNVRQLQHLVERLTILAPNNRIDRDAVDDALLAMESREKPVETLAAAEEEQIRRVLAATGGNKSRAAQILGIERKTLYRKLDKMGL